MGLRKGLFRRRREEKGTIIRGLDWGEDGGGSEKKHKRHPFTGYRGSEERAEKTRLKGGVRKRENEAVLGS